MTRCCVAHILDATRRCDDISRALARYLARDRFGYAVVEVAEALGYKSHGSVGQAIRRMQATSVSLKRLAQRLKAALSKR